MKEGECPRNDRLEFDLPGTERRCQRRGRADARHSHIRAEDRDEFLATRKDAKRR